VRSALITGITGQDGGYLAEQLVAQGTRVHGLVRPAEEVPEHLSALGDAVVLHEAALDDEAALRSALDAAAPQSVFNLAGVSSVALSWDQPALTAQVNGMLVARLLQLIWELQEEAGEQVRFVQASSAEIFAGAVSAPQDESTPLSPRSPYGASKAFAHCLVQAFRERGMHASNAILYNHESPRRPATFVTRKITSAVAAIAQGRTTELVLGNLEARRDWGWAPEYVDAMVRIAQHEAADDYVVATGEAHSVEDFVSAAFAHVHIQDWRRFVLTDPGLVRPADAVELRGDSTHAHQQLGWSPRTRFEELVSRMVDADLGAVPRAGSGRRPANLSDSARG
jgi:GDPmannose 4,6-dehydratase